MTCCRCRSSSAWAIFNATARIGVRQWEVADTRQQRATGNLLHDDVGLHAKIARGDELRDMNAGQPRHDELFHLEADDCRGIFALGEIWHFHHQRQRRAFLRHAPDGGHVAAVDTFVEAEAVDD